MRLSRTSLHVLLVAALVTAGVVACSWVWRQRSDAVVQAARSTFVAAHLRDARARGLVFARQVRELRQTLQDCSNRVAAVEAQYHEEESTHDPLRRQIETMLEEQVAQKTQLDRKDTLLRQVQESLAKLRQQRDQVELELTNHVQRSDRLELELTNCVQRSARLEKDLSAQLAEARQDLAAARAKLAESEQHLREARQQIEEKDRTIADLRQTREQAPATK